MIGHNHLGKNGRFGNQMFQYAATRGIAERNGYDWVIPDGPKTDEEFTDEENQHKLLMAFKLPGALKLGMYDAPYHREKSFRFDIASFEYCPDNVNIHGYFQSEKYFRHIEDLIRKDFTFRDDVQELCNNMWEQIVEANGHTEAISLHIRRTDHLIKPTFHPVLPLSYYEEALSKFPQDIPVIIFSDDPDWCMEQEIFSGDRFFVSNSDNIHDMCLMSMCEYNIIANSTFSWWGAWIAGHDRVIAPKLWFGPDGEDASDLYVGRWEYLDV